MAAEHVQVEKPTVIDRSLGDIHPGGNPHVHLNPENILIIAAVLGKRMITIDPENAAYYRNRLTAFNSFGVGQLRLGILRRHARNCAS